MDMQKGLAIGILLAAGVLIAAVAGVLGKVPIPTPEEAAYAAFSNEELGLAFSYPARYELKTFSLENEAQRWVALTLIEKDILRAAEENGASEGPPAIAIQVFENPSNLAADEWVRTSSFSNFQLVVDQRLSSTTVGGETGYAYHYSGLYASDAVVVAKGARVYLFVVDWLTEDDANRSDFKAILDTVTFI